MEGVHATAFGRATFQSGQNDDGPVQPEVLDRLLAEGVLKPGTALIRYSWKAEPTGYTYQAPSGPPYAPMSLFDPSGSSKVLSGLPASTAGEELFRRQSSLL